MLLLLLLQGCYKTELPAIGYRYGLPVPELHIVHRGDTLFSIGKRYNMDYHKLIRFNHIAPPYTIFVGQRIYLTHAAPKATTNFIPQQHAKPQRHTHHANAKKAKKKRVVSKKTAMHRHRVTPLSRRARSSHHHASAYSKAVSTVPLRWPTTGPVTSGFGTRGSRMHDGIDIGGKLGTPVVAAAKGVVVYADHRLSGYGNLIIIRHQKRLFTAYAHNKENLVQRGDHVRAGQKIATVGRTGRSTGPHLHFEVRRGTTPVDPMLYLPKRSSR